MTTTQKQKVLFIITKAEIGGAQKFVKEQIDVCSNIFDAYLCTNQEGWLLQQTSEQLRGYYLNKSIKKNFSITFLFQLYRYIKKNEINLVIANSANAGFYGRVAAFFANVPVYYVSHGWSAIYNGHKLNFILKRVEKLLAKITKKIICVSQSDYNIAINKIRISANKLVVIKNSTLPIYKQRTEIGLNNDLIKIIALARFANPKRIDLMIKSFEQIKNAELFIAGNGPDFEMWNQYVSDRKIKNVKLLGEVKSFSKFNEYDAFMLISNSEGLPISAIEAMSAGLPLILSNVGGCPELIDDNGTLVENNIQSIANGVNSVIDNYARYQRNSLELYNKEFNLINVKSKYIDLYNSLINKQSN